jgi:D-alanyl-D-alanine dipeptidase
MIVSLPHNYWLTKPNRYSINWIKNSNTVVIQNMAKTCNYNSCATPVWSKGRCKWHQEKALQPQNRQKIKTISDKELKRLAEYRPLRDKFLKANPTCMIHGCKGKSTLHHAKGRIGDNLTDVSTFRNLCINHHRYAEEHPDWAKENGLSLNRLS